MHLSNGPTLGALPGSVRHGHGGAGALERGGALRDLEALAHGTCATEGRAERAMGKGEWW